MADREPHTYDRPLSEGEIRILTVLPGEFGTPVICELHRVRLEERPTYDALSYCWGNSERSQDMSICTKTDGLCVMKRFNVTESVYEALQHLRRKDEGLQIWIDQICINQDDLDEKSAQVEQMGDIYAQCECTRAWLGPQAQGLESALEICLDFLEHAHDQAWVHRNYASIMEIMCRLRCRRLWVWQEVALATQCTLTYGTVTKLFPNLGLPSNLNEVSTSTQNLLVALANDTESRFTFLRSAGALNLMGTLRTSVPGRGAAIMPVMMMSRIALCSEPQDHVFGLQGILRRAAGATFEQHFRVDYTETVDVTFTKATVALLMGAGATAGVDLVRIEEERADRSNLGLMGPIWRHNLPSWVPDYAHAFWGGKEALFVPSHYSAGGSVSHMFILADFSSNCRVLSLDGVAMGEVAELEVCTDPLDEAFTRRLRAMLEGALASVHYQDAAQRSKAFARTKCADVLHAEDNSSKRWPSDMPASDTRKGRDGEGGATTPSEEMSYRYPELTGRSFLISDTGHFALGPSYTRAGDDMVIFAGIPMPFVLRKRSEGPNYQVIGPAYLHGFMDGEAIGWSMDESGTPIPRAEGDFVLETFSVD